MVVFWDVPACSLLDSDLFPFSSLPHQAVSFSETLVFTTRPENLKFYLGLIMVISVIEFVFLRIRESRGYFPCVLGAFLAKLELHDVWPHVTITEPLNRYWLN